MSWELPPRFHLVGLFRLSSPQNFIFFAPVIYLLQLGKTLNLTSDRPWKGSLPPLLTVSLPCIPSAFRTGTRKLMKSSALRGIIFCFSHIPLLHGPPSSSSPLCSVSMALHEFNKSSGFLVFYLFPSTAPNLPHPAPSLTAPLPPLALVIRPFFFSVSGLISSPDNSHFCRDRLIILFVPPQTIRPDPSFRLSATIRALCSWFQTPSRSLVFEKVWFFCLNSALNIVLVHGDGHSELGTFLSFLLHLLKQPPKHFPSDFDVSRSSPK